MANDDADLIAELRSLLAAGQKIEAIKRYREQTGASLAEAKTAVERLQRQGPSQTAQPADSPLEEEISALLERGQKIQAIKLFREQTGTGLKEAKQAVEAIAAERGIASPGGAGCLGLLLFVVVLLAGPFISLSARFFL